MYDAVIVYISNIFRYIYIHNNLIEYEYIFLKIKNK